MNVHCMTSLTKVLASTKNSSRMDTFLKFISSLLLLFSFFSIIRDTALAKDNASFEAASNPWEELEKKDALEKKIEKLRFNFFDFVHKSPDLKKLFPPGYNPFTNPCDNHPILLLKKAMSPPVVMGKKFPNKSIDLIKTRLGALRMPLTKEYGKQSNKVYQKLYKEIMTMVTEYNNLIDEYNNFLTESSRAKRKKNKI